MTTTTTREALIRALAYDSMGGLATEQDITSAEQLLDAHRAEVLAEPKVETVDWLVKKAHEYRSTGGRQHALQAEAITTLASKVDRGAVRAFLGIAHYRDAMDGHRAEVLREASDVVRGMDTAPSTRAAADELRRMADEAEAQR